MIGLATFPPIIAKEIRALFPAWIACMAVIGAGFVIHHPMSQGFVLLACGLGSLMLGAQSIGHEYSHRTLQMLLAQPSDRKRLLLAKMAVLAPMLLTIGTTAWLVLGDDSRRLDPLWRQGSFLGLTAICGLFVTPWLTMVCRGALPAVVFTIAIPASILVAGDLIGIAKYGVGAGAVIDRFKVTFFWWSVSGLCAAAALAGWRMFMKLEAIEGAGAEISMPDVMRDEAAVRQVRRSHPIGLLVRKELHLQQMTFVIVGLYLLVWLSISMSNRLVPDIARYAWFPLSALYSVLLSLLIGALAIAEERQHGTLEWQLLLPMPMWKQWAVKVGMALGLAVLFGIGLPILLMAANRSEGDALGIMRGLQETSLTVLVLTACSLYLSSISSSGVRAMVLSLPAIAGTFLYFQAVHWAVDWAIFRHWIHPRPELVRTFFENVRSTQRVVMVVMALVFVAALLRYASMNHRSAERSPAHLLKQSAGIAGLLTVWVLALAAVRIYYFSG